MATTTKARTAETTSSRAKVKAKEQNRRQLQKQLDVGLSDMTPYM
jgi:hypothetical protein